MGTKMQKLVPSEEEIAKLVKEVAALKEKCRRFAISLSPEERQQTLKVRPGSERVVSIVARVAKEQNCDVPGLPIEDMLLWQRLADRVQPLIETVASIDKILSDTALKARSEAWRAATAYYSALNRFGMEDPDVRAELLPAIEFFAVHKRRQLSPAESSNTTEPPEPPVEPGG